jgi:hypothetical protein
LKSIIQEDEGQCYASWKFAIENYAILFLLRINHICAVLVAMHSSMLPQTLNHRPSILGENVELDRLC